MFYNARNCNIKIDDTDMDYISFGNGNKSLVIIPGLGDALKTVKGTAVTFALMYKLFAKDYKVYVFSRKNKLKQDCSTRDMATDLASVMNQLNITKAFVLGVSQGGMIAQYLAIDYPELVEKLVLAVTLCQPNETSKSVISNWLSFAKEKDFKQIFIDTAEKTYTGGDNDKIVGSSSSCELANHIAQSKLKIYNGLGHSTYEEAKDFNSQVLSFFNN